ncbi:MAG: cold shock domain-containing protein [Planctomycetaceae bacterium]|nr:cold-shock protein [Planctomycetota bacterium]NUO16876.1 cold shock domain-containing protein [Planctomycetaceae bacterium]RIK60073.1 MAG: cold-shock protein [Planctomycetota bacterium]HRJ78654.1 cold shock domain-containing protein [Planctomycetota bacterium]
MATSTIRTRGVVKWYDPRKGYGYITRQGAPQVFLHYSKLKSDFVPDIKAGDEVEFLCEQTGKGPIAHNVKLINH